MVGTGVGCSVGAAVGSSVGTGDGAAVGSSVGTAVGCSVGAAVGSGLGATVGPGFGSAVGKLVGVGVGPVGRSWARRSARGRRPAPSSARASASPLAGASAAATALASAQPSGRRTAPPSAGGGDQRWQRRRAACRDGRRRLRDGRNRRRPLGGVRRGHGVGIKNRYASGLECEFAVAEAQEHGQPAQLVFWPSRQVVVSFTYAEHTPLSLMHGPGSVQASGAGWGVDAGPARASRGAALVALAKGGSSGSPSRRWRTGRCHPLRTSQRTPSSMVVPAVVTLAGRHPLVPRSGGNLRRCAECLLPVHDIREQRVRRFTSRFCCVRAYGIVREYSQPTTSLDAE